MSTAPSGNPTPNTNANAATHPSSILIDSDSRASQRNTDPTQLGPASSAEGHGDPFRSRDGSPRHLSRHLSDSRDLPPTERNHPTSHASIEKLEDYERYPGVPELNRNSGVGLAANQALPPLPAARLSPGFRRQMTAETRFSAAGRSMLDHNVPIEEKRITQEHTVFERLQPTLTVAMAERDKYERKARMTGYALNAAIGLQVLLGSLTTGLSAVATSGKSAAVQTTILGGLSTIVASYLARSRGSNEPELSIARTKDLEQFIRECEAFKMDHGHVVGTEYDRELETFRRRFEELLGNANGERRLAPLIP